MLKRISKENIKKMAALESHLEEIENSIKELYNDYGNGINRTVNIEGICTFSTDDIGKGILYDLIIKNLEEEKKNLEEEIDRTLM